MANGETTSRSKMMKIVKHFSLKVKSYQESFPQPFAAKSNNPMFLETRPAL